MKIGVIADDFTGASDIALTLAEGGMRVVQFVGVPEGAAGDIDAGDTCHGFVASLLLSPGAACGAGSHR